MALERAVKTDNSTGFKFVKKGDSLQGYYLGTTVKPINGKDTDVHAFRTESGINTVLGQADIKSQIKNNGITKGTWMEITFTGEMQKLKAGRTMKLYDVAFDRDNTDLESSYNPNEAEDAEEDEEELESEEVAYVPPTPPRTATQVPNTTRQAQFQAAINKSKSKATVL